VEVFIKRFSTPVEAGLGVTLLPLMSVHPNRRGTYQVAVLKEPAITRESCLVTLKGKLFLAARTCVEMTARAEGAIQGVLCAAPRRAAPRHLPLWARERSARAAMGF
jgi:hypothetical protein